MSTLLTAGALSDFHQIMMLRLKITKTTVLYNDYSTTVVSSVMYQILLMAGFPGLVLSSKGKRPVSSWCAITPADQMSEAGTTAELSTSGAMNLHHHHKGPIQPNRWLLQCNG